MIALDTNVLIYAHRRDSAWHDRASSVTATLAGSRAPWAIPWPCLHEFYGIVTHPRIFSPPSTKSEAIDQIDEWLRSPRLLVLSELGAYWPQLRRLLTEGQVVGPRVHDARIAALCQLHGVREIWTADRDFRRFPGLRSRNPLVG